ncbi:MAG: adenylate/guanylate cyclase domain-containing protein [Actinomycetota bacterium]|nr:adenylate/guanylate cyclase domain-containing protein [Actinomycetota bacterium]
MSETVALPDTAPSGMPFALRTVVGVAAAVIAANIFGILTVAALLIGLNANTPHGERVVILTTAASYAAAATTLGTIIGVTRHKRTLHWLVRGRFPDRQEARRALRTPIDLALLCGLLWMLAAIVLSSLVAGLGGGLNQAGGYAGGLFLAGLSTAGVSYLLVARLTRPVIQLALAAHPPRRSMLLPVRDRLLLNWLLTTGIPVLGIILVLSVPPSRSHVRGAGILLAAVALAIGFFSNALAARAIGVPLRNLLDVLHRVGQGELEEGVVVDDPGEIGMLQNGVNEMLAGLRERDHITDMFGRHVGSAVAEQVLREGVTLSGENRHVVALFVDITGSTALTRKTNPREMVAMLNRFFGIVVDAVEAAGGLVNKFEGDAALCIFGAPVALDDPATAGLCTARRIRDEVHAGGEVDIGIGVAAGPVVAGQIGAASRLEYTVIGDAVNEAARLTELAKQCAARVLASADVVFACSPEEQRHWTPAATVTLRGQDEPIATFTAQAQPSVAARPNPISGSP